MTIPSKDTTGKANDYQVGGSHYSQAGIYQHWDFVEDHGIGYLEGYCTKYLVRWDKKGTPVQDLEKSSHTLKKLIELSEAGKRKNRCFNVPSMESIGLFCSANHVSHEEIVRAIALIYRWESTMDLEEAYHRIVHVLEAQPSRRIAKEYADGKKKSEGMEHPFGYDEKEEVRETDNKDSALWSAPGAQGPEAGKDKESPTKE